MIIPRSKDLGLIEATFNDLSRANCDVIPRSKDLGLIEAEDPVVAAAVKEANSEIERPRPH